MVNSTHPAKNVSNTTKSTGISRVYSTVTSDMSDVAPMETSLIVPNKT